MEKSEVSLEVTYEPNFLSEEESKQIFEELSKLTFLQPKVKIRGNYIPIPRRQIAFGLEGTSYRYSGTQTHSLQGGWPPYLVKVKERLEQRFSEGINFVLVNKYRNGDDYIGYHRDDERDLQSGKPILSVSIGAERDFLFKNFANKKLIVKYKLASGSMLAIQGHTNRKWMHSLPKRKRVKDIRYNLTFRYMKTV